MTNTNEIAKEKTSYYLQKDVGILKISGEDRIDFLHRQSTNDIYKVNEDRNIVISVLTTPKARIIDVLTIFQHDEDLYVITLPFRGPSTYQYLKSKIFFMDKVKIIDISEEFNIIEIEGLSPNHILENILNEKPDLEKFNVLEKFNKGFIGGQRGLVSELSHFLMIDNSNYLGIVEELNNNLIPELDWKTRELFRIQSSIPGPENELNGDYTPLENKLEHAISNNKGCYTGQEIIARQVNYDKITKNLAQIHLDKIVDIGSKISSNGKNAGTITSIAKSPQHGILALAMLKRPYFELGTELEIAYKDEIISGQVVNSTK